MLLRYLIILLLLIPATTTFGQSEDALKIRKIYHEILQNGQCYHWLEDLCLNIGHRLSGTPEAAAAVEWSRQVMADLHPDTVYLQPVMVPRWIRGETEHAKALSNKTGEQELNICALGGSVGTPEGGIVASVIEVRDFDHLRELGKRNIKDKIVFYNSAMQDTFISTFSAYSDAGRYRWNGAVEAAKLGAKAVIIRSLTTALDDHPHTGSMSYETGVKRIPAAAVSTRGAEWLSQALKQDNTMRIHLELSCDTLPDVLSYNVIAELKGSMEPEAFITLGGHLDAWDVGHGAHDDGAGCVQTIEVLRTFLELDIRPRHTLRFVMFMNEENGVRGGKKYAAVAAKRGEKHVAAIESDAGGFAPRGFGIKGDEVAVHHVEQWRQLLEPYGLHRFPQGFGGVDINPLHAHGTVCLGLIPESHRYFDYHHAPSDTFDKVNKRELEMGAAAMTTMVYLLDKYGMSEQ